VKTRSIPIATQELAASKKKIHQPSNIKKKEDPKARQIAKHHQQLKTAKYNGNLMHINDSRNPLYHETKTEKSQQHRRLTSAKQPATTKSIPIATDIRCKTQHTESSDSTNRAKQNDSTRNFNKSNQHHGTNTMAGQSRI
jgi:hypothetical protein